jgi:RNA polymerase sigma-70 factor (ECF subfamily)
MHLGVAKLALKDEQSSRQQYNPEINHNDLIARCRKGDDLAMEALYQHYRMPLFNLAYRLSYDRAIAEDLLQEIFIKVFVSLGELRQEEAFKAWIYRIAVNTCISYLRVWKKRNKNLVPISQVEWKLGQDDLNEDNELIKQQLDKAIEELPEKLRSVFLLHDVQGFKHKEIAQILRCSIGTSKSQLFKARMKIRQYLKKKSIK